jgi:hypothetical protein
MFRRLDDFSNHVDYNLRFVQLDVMTAVLRDDEFAVTRQLSEFELLLSFLIADTFPLLLAELTWWIAVLKFWQEHDQWFVAEWHWFLRSR